MVKTKNAEEEFQSKIQEMKGKISEMESQLEHKIEKNPISSVAIAFGAGAIIGTVATMLTRNKRGD